VGLGCEISNVPCGVGPDRGKLWTLSWAIIGLCAKRRASPGAVSSMLGLAQWFCILSRPHFGCFNQVTGLRVLSPQT